MSETKELIPEPLYEYGGFQVCYLCPASDSESETKDPPAPTSRVIFTSLRRAKLAPLYVPPSKEENS
jgi:hypothetical protein